MIQFIHSLLVLGLATQISWASPQGLADSDAIEKRSPLEPGDQYVFATCPKTLQKCKECGGDTKKKGFCDNERAQGSMFQYYRCKQLHKTGCGLICECVSEETGGPGTGLPPIIPFPPPPPGFVVPPAGVPNPKTPCKEDYTQTSCKDCKALEGWCTEGANAGCPCKEECPADDKKPKCTDDTCKGEEKATCTIGQYKDCKCKAECPDPKKKALICSNKSCEGKDGKCTTGANNGCACNELANLIFTLGSKPQAEKSEKILAELSKYLKEHEGDGDKPKEPKETKCSSSDYSKAVDVDISFMQKIADKFCDGDMSKKRSQDLTSKDISGSAYDKYSFHLEYNPGKNCKTDCKATFKTMIAKCEGYNSHSIQLEGSASFDCDASYSYRINAPDKPKPKPDPGFEQHGLQERKCHGKDDFGGHGDVRGSEISMSATGCAGISDDKAKLKEGSQPVKLQSTYGGTKLQFTMSWIDNCKGPEQDARFPFGEPHNLGNTCWQLLLDDWQKCNNGGAGGSIDYSCVRYDFRPTFD